MPNQEHKNQYSLGSSERETERLVTQGALVAPRLEQLFRDAGIREGMSVLDIGSGAGDVALLAREFVGEAGRVTGIDKDRISIARARARVEEAGLTNVTFVEADLSDSPIVDEEFDAIVGRRIWMYLPDRAEILRHILKYLRAGAIVAFQELDTEHEHAPVVPYSELYDRIARWAWNAFKATGAETRMGSQLEQLLIDCDLESVRVDIGPRVEDREPERALARIDNQIGTGRSLLPVMYEHHIAPREELDRVEEYLGQIRREVEQGIRVPVAYGDYNVWAKKPRLASQR